MKSVTVGARVPPPLLAVAAPALIPALGTLFALAALAVIGALDLPVPLFLILAFVVLMIPGASRFVALLPHRKRLVLAAAIAMPLSAAATVVAVLGGFLVHFDFMSTPAASDEAKWGVEGALLYGGPAAVIVAAIEAALAGLSSFGTTGAGTAALAMHAGWYVALVLLIGGSSFWSGPGANPAITVAAIVGAVVVQLVAGSIGGIASVGIGKAWAALRRSATAGPV